MAVLVFCASVLAQQPDVPLIKSESREVVLDVIVRDAKGRFIRDLAAADFKIAEDGTAVQPKGFRLVTGTAADGTNLQAKQVRLVTFLFDGIGPDSRILAREGALTLMKTAAGANVYFSVMIVSGRLRMLAPFTQDQRVLREAIDRATIAGRNKAQTQTEQAEQVLRNMVSNPEQEKRLLQGDTTSLNERGSDPSIAKMMLNMLDADQTISREMKGRPSLAALQAVVREQYRLEGRKTVVFFTEGLSVPENLAQQFSEIVSSANKSNVSIYPMDVSGLNYRQENAESAAMLLSAATQSATMAQREAKGQLKASDMVIADSAIASTRVSLRSPLDSLADSTGGFLTANTNDLREAARRVAEEATTYYEVTYTPPPAPLDGKFRTIAVSLGRPKLQVQSRKGYLAVPVAPGRALRAFEVPLLAALTQGSNRHEFNHRFALLPLRPSGAGVECALLLETPLEELHFDQDKQAGSTKVHGSAVAVLRNPDGEVLERFGWDGAFQAPLDREDVFKRTVWPIEQKVVLAPGNYILETAVSDRVADRVSISRLKLKIEPWGAGPALSGTTYVRRAYPMKPGATPLFRAEDRALEPELKSEAPGGKGPPLTVYSILRGAPNSKDPVKVEVELMRGSESISRAVVFNGPAQGEVPLVAGMDVSSLDGGDYQIRLKAVQGGAETTTALPLHVEEWQKPQNAAALPPAPVVAAKKAAEWDAPPPTEEQNKLLSAARLLALGYSEALPNFTCLRVTRRLEDPTGKEEWREKDEYTDTIIYLNGKEHYAKVADRTRNVPGQQKDQAKATVTSGGEFGPLLHGIFAPESKTEFGWLRANSIRGRPVQVFAYRVARENSKYIVRYREQDESSATAAYKGFIAVDEQTAMVLQVGAELEELPADYRIQALKVTVDYDTVAVAGHDYNLPISATLAMRYGRQSLVRNDLQFSGYRRFEAESKIKYLPE